MAWIMELERFSDVEGVLNMKLGNGLQPIKDSRPILRMNIGFYIGAAGLWPFESSFIKGACALGVRETVCGSHEVWICLRGRTFIEDARWRRRKRPPTPSIQHPHALAHLKPTSQVPQPSTRQFLNTQTL